MELYCRTCRTKFISTRKKIYCSLACRNSRVSKCYNGDISCGTKGAISELIVCSKLLNDGFSVFRAVSPSEFCDVIAIKGVKMFKIEVRTAQTYPNGTFNFSRLTSGNIAKPDYFAIVGVGFVRFVKCSDCPPGAVSIESCFENLDY